MATGTIKHDWSKYEVDSNGDFVTNADGDFVEKAAPKIAKPNPRDQVTFLGSENLGKLMADVFPRMARGTVEGKGAGAQAGAGLLDAISLPGRGIAASGEAPKDATWKDGNPSLGKIEGDRFVEKVLRDPGTGAAILAAPFTGGLSAIPEIGALGEIIQGARAANFARLGAQGLAAGTASATAHQGENLLNSKDVNPYSAAGEVALNALIPVAGKAIAPIIKGAGVKIYNSILKPSEATIKAGFAPSKAEVLKGTEKFLETGRGGGGLGGAYENVDSRIEDLNNQIEEIVKQKSRKATVTSKGPAPKNPEAKSGINISGGVSEPPIYMAPEQAAQIEGGNILLPESTIPAAPDVVRAGMNRPPLITTGKPEIIITPPPRPKSVPPDVAITPNPVQMPNRIDPRFTNDRAMQQMQLSRMGDLPPGQEYGIPSDRNIPAIRPNIQSPTAGAQAIPIQGEYPFSAEELKAIGRAPGVPGIPIEPSSVGFVPPNSTPPLGLPPGSPETVTDISKIIDLLGALNSTKRGMGQELGAGQHAGLAEDIGSGQNQWLADLEARGFDKPVDPMQAITYQRGVGAMGKFNYGQNPQLVPPKARVANEYYGQIGDRLQEVAPEIAPLRQEISSLIPQRMALTDARARTNKNFALGLKEAIAALGAVNGAAVNGPVGALPGLSMAGAIHASQSPRIGNFLFNQGKSLSEQSAVRDAIKRALLQNGFSVNDQTP